MLEEIDNCILNIEQTDRKYARTLYDRAMSEARDLADEFEYHRIDAVDLQRIYDEVYAAQELAYAYFLERGEVIADDAIAPERPQDNFNPPGLTRTWADRADWRQDILQHLRRHYPHTLPSQMR